MPIDSLHPEMPSDELHAVAIGFASVKEANLVLEHPSCSELTKQMVVAKLYLFDQKEFKNIDNSYHSDIIAVAQKFGDPTATTG